MRKVFNLKQDEEDEDEEDVPVYKMNMGDQPGDKEYFVELKHYQAVNEQLKVRKVFNLKQDEEDVPVYKMNMGDQPGDKEYFVELKDYQAVSEQLKVRKVFNLKQDEEDEDEEDVPVYKLNMGDQPGDKEYFVELKDYQAVNEQLKVRTSQYRLIYLLRGVLRYLRFLNRLVPNTCYLISPPYAKTLLSSSVPRKPMFVGHFKRN